MQTPSLCHAHPTLDSLPFSPSRLVNPGGDCALELPAQIWNLRVQFRAPPARCVSSLPALGVPRPHGARGMKGTSQRMDSRTC